MSDFILSTGFCGVVNAFGWPVVRTWPGVLAGVQRSALRESRYATREIATILPFSPLETIQQDEREWAGKRVREQGATLAFSAFEPTAWSLVRFCLWPSLPGPSGSGAQAYKLLHLSVPAGVIPDFS